MKQSQYLNPMFRHQIENTVGKTAEECTSNRFVQLRKLHRIPGNVCENGINVA